MTQSTERLLIVALLIVIAMFSLQTCFKKDAEVTSLKDVVEAKQDTLKHWKDKAGIEHGEKVMAEADMSIIKAAYQKEIDSITNVLKIRESQLQAYTGISTKETGTIVTKVDTVFTDSSKLYTFDYADKWLALNGSIGKDAHINYSIVDSLGITIYNKRRNLFATPQTFIDVYSLNPKVRVTGLTGFRIKPKMPGRIGIGPYVGYGYTSGKWQPSAGISIQYSLIRF